MVRIKGNDGTKPCRWPDGILQWIPFHQRQKLRMVLQLYAVVVVLCVLYILGPGRLSGDSEETTALYRSYANLIVDTSHRFDFESHTPTITEGPMRILYVVTSSSKTINNWWGGGMEHFGTDRLRELIVPVIVDSIESMQSYGHHVDLYLILDYVLTSEEETYLRKQLPNGVGLEVWNDATPIAYEDSKTDRYVRPISRSLSRQHRFVVRDKLMKYDFFACYEDDMRITGGHVEYYMNMSGTIHQWRQDAPHVAPERIGRMAAQHAFFGTMSKKQLRSVQPGFLRVEVLLDEFWYPTQWNIGPVQAVKQEDVSIDQTICCNSSRVKAPSTPNRLMLWETALEGMALREMPDGQWYALLPGPYRQKSDARVGKLSSHSLEPKIRTLSAVDPDVLAQSAGWMMTRTQILELHADICKGSFLPPFDLKEDGLYMHNVEFWSGGLQLWCARDGCNIQRIVSLDDFSKHLLYHTSNNKQKLIDRKRRVRANVLLGQLMELRKRAMMQKVGKAI